MVSKDNKQNQSPDPVSAQSSGQTISDEISQEINQQTGVIDWQELVKHFARGVVVRVDAELDLVDVAHSMSIDDKTCMQNWLDKGTVRRASDDDARQWTKDNPQFWCVVVAPWVLVQTKGSEKDIH